MLSFLDRFKSLFPPITMTEENYPGLPDEEADDLIGERGFERYLPGHLIAPELFPEVDEDEEDPVVVMTLGDAETLTEGEEWEEVHPRYRSMSQAAHKALCYRRTGTTKAPCGFHLPRKP